MPWSNQSGGGNQGGGPWGGGGGPGGPWGRPPQGGGPGGTPPDLEELIRRSQDRLRRVLPGGGGLGARGIGLLLVIAAAAITLWNSWFIIEEGQAGIVTRFGAYQAPPRPPGFHFMLWPIDQVQTIRVTRQNLEEIGFQTRGNTRREVPDEALMLTRDENIVSVGFTVSWSIRTDRPQDFLFNIADQQGAVRAVAESAMREVVGRNTAEDIIVRGQTILQTEVTRILQDTLDSYQAGIQINALSISRPEVPPAVREAFNDVQQAAQDAQTFQNQARRDAGQLLADARAAANQVRQEADSYAQRVVAEAEGEASRFLAIFNEYRAAPEVTQRRIFLETMERVFRGTNKIILDQSQGGQSVLPLLPLGRVLEGLTTPAPAQGQTR